MVQSDSKVLVLGALAGIAGVSLAVVCYRYKGFKVLFKDSKSQQKQSSPRSSSQRKAKGDQNLMSSCGSSLPRGQVEVLERVEALFQCISELKEEMKELKNVLPDLQEQVREEMKCCRACSLQRTRLMQRKRPSRTIIPEDWSSEDTESEGGYMTALTDSEEEEPNEGEQGDKKQPEDELNVLLKEVDRLHEGTEFDKRESLNILLKQEAEFGQDSRFLWRLTRAYCDVHDISSTLEEKKTHAETGKRVGEEAVTLNPLCAESHQWFAIMCGIMTEYDTVQNKIKNGYIFKDHLDKAIELKPQDPLSYYLLGRWCYSVAQLSWIERKAAAALFGEPPSATVEDALKNFLKCYKDLGKINEARTMCEAAYSMDTISKEDEEAQKELDSLCYALGV
uniref:Regulator of microtubule dynamics protein 2 n=1 Tax=Oryzias latipes TaxID=8090 RepID=A0A3P9HRG5_ORYLA